MGKAGLLLHEVARQRGEQKRESDTDKAKRLVKRLTPKQRAFVLDKSRFKAALCPRRSGKSFAILVYALAIGLTRPGAKILVLARVRRQARGVYWDPLKRLCEEFELDVHFRNVLLECVLGNGSQILFAGADTQEEIDKYRGQGYDLVAIDECKSYSAMLLDELVREVITPALMDRMGTLVLIGTPGPVPNGLFWAITTCQKEYRPPWADRPQSLGVRRWEGKAHRGKYYWSLHTWTMQDNVACPWIWDEALARKEQQGLDDDNPIWLREYLGQWVPDHDSLVYAYWHLKDNRADWHADGDGPHGLSAEHKWRYILGMDLGWHDATAFVVAAWSPTHKVLHFIHVERHSEMTVEQIAARVKNLERKYGAFDARVADTGGLGKTIIESLAQTYGVTCEAARKQDKHDHIKLMNSDLLSGRIALEPTSELAEEWRTLQWAGPDRRIEDPNCVNHAADAALYIWRYAHHHWNVSVPEKVERESEQWWKEYHRKEVESAKEQRRRENEPWWKQYKSKMDKIPLAWTIYDELSG